MPIQPEKRIDGDEDYEIVSFEEFCDKSPGSKTDLLTINDNINYRLFFEGDKTAKFENDGEGSSIDAGRQSETSLNDSKSVSFRRLSGSFAPFGRFNASAGRASLFSGVIPKAKSDAEATSRDHRYQQFSRERNIFQRCWDSMPGPGSTMLGVALVIALFVGAWWAVYCALGGNWGDDHYKKLWERAHLDSVKKPWAPVPNEKILPENRYHDHNNLSTKNKLNATEATKKKTEPNKKSSPKLPTLKEECSVVQEDMRFDCAPDGNKTICDQRDCCWKPAATKGAPYCFYPRGYRTYRFHNMTENKHGMTAYYANVRASGYPGDFAFAKIDFRYLSDEVLQIKITDAQNKRFEAPIPEIPAVSGPVANLKYKVELQTRGAGIRVIRTSDNVTIINTRDAGAMILSDKFLQISAVLPTDHIFGLGEHRARFMRDVKWKTYTIFNRDVPPQDNTNLYGSHPFYLAVENNGKSHGMLLHNSNAMDVTLQPTPAITFRSIGGVLDLLLFTGPSPQQVVAQYTGIVGRPFMPPYWSLGFHLCKYGYGSLNETRRVWKTNRDAGIPFDVQWNDIDYMVDQNDFTYDKDKYDGLPQFVRELHFYDMRYVILIDPGISAGEASGTYPPFDIGLEMDVFVKNKTDQPFVGKVWNKSGKTVYPDFTHPNASSYWSKMMGSFHQEVPFDGAWIDMNEPSNFIAGELDGECEPENLPYKPSWISSTGLKDKTLCMDAKHYIGRHYDVHNLYSGYEAIATNRALTETRDRRPFVISRSSFPGLGQYAGHWTGDISSTWEDMRMTIPMLLHFSLFGIPMIGADICGFTGDTTVALCKRWSQLGAFYPFARNHADNHARPQDPVSLGPEVVEANIKALRLRYSLLPYYYTLFWRANTRGDTVIRPLFFEFPENTKLHEIDDQFLVGAHVMVTPLLHELANTSKAFFPGPQRWYHLVTGRFVASDKWHDVSEDDIVSVKGGAILGLQNPPTVGPVNVKTTRSQPLQLLVAPDNAKSAHGEMYWDDGDKRNSYEEKSYSYVEMFLKDETLSTKVHWWGHGMPPIQNITILAQPNPTTAVYINGVPCQKKPTCEFMYDAKSQSLSINVIYVFFDTPFNITWSYKNTDVQKVSKTRKEVRNKIVGYQNKHSTDND